MKVNLHTHTVRCGHAEGTDEEYVLAALEKGYDMLGFSDHTPFPFEDGSTGGRMADLEEYIGSVGALEEKYKGKINIRVGLECEMYPRYLDYLRQIRPKLDYMILGSHGDIFRGAPHSAQLRQPQQLWHYLEETVAGMETGLFLYLAHPDIMFGEYPTFDDTARQVSRQLCREANRLGLPLEYNLLGVLKGRDETRLGYPCDAFWEVAAEENVRAVVGVDAHAPHQIQIGDLEGAQKKLRNLGLQVLENPLEAG